MIIKIKRLTGMVHIKFLSFAFLFISCSNEVTYKLKCMEIHSNTYKKRQIVNPYLLIHIEIDNNTKEKLIIRDGFKDFYLTKGNDTLFLGRKISPNKYTLLKGEKDILLFYSKINKPVFDYDSLVEFIDKGKFYKNNLEDSILQPTLIKKSIDFNLECPTFNDDYDGEG